MSDEISQIVLMKRNFNLIIKIIFFSTIVNKQSANIEQKTVDALE